MRGSRKEQPRGDAVRAEAGAAGCGGLAASQRKRGFTHFSLTRLLYASPLMPRRVNRNNSQQRSAKSSDERGASAASADGPSSQDVERGDRADRADRLQRLHGQASASGAESGKWSLGIVCPLCLNDQPSQNYPELLTCAHRSCYDCFQKYLRVEISESRVNIACPECTAPMHPSDIRMILNDNVIFEKYEDFMVRRVLACDPDTRWCPAPDCSFAVIAAGCASCPKIKCGRDGCDSHFCYHCKAEWHPNQTCDSARALRSPDSKSTSSTFNHHARLRDDVKPCPRCQVLIGKMDDGSCNHMQCAVCGAEFCWLCMKEVTDLHFLSPSGCTFWGKKPWSRKKKILWQLGTLVGAPVGIGLIAGIAVPAMIIGLPVWVGKKIYTRYEFANKHKRNLAIFGGVTATIVASPFLAALAVSIGAPVLLCYVYGVVPVAMCRSRGCGVLNAAQWLSLDDLDGLDGGVADKRADQEHDGVSLSHRGVVVNPSIGEVSISMGSGSHLERLGRDGDAEGAFVYPFGPDREDQSVSNVAIAGASLTGASLAGSIAGVSAGQRLEIVDVAQTHRFSMTSETASAATSLSEKSVSASLNDDGAASTRALAGSIANYKMDSVSGVVSVEDTISDSFEELAAGPVVKRADFSTNRRRTNPDRQTSDTESAGSCFGGNEDCVSVDRVRFDDNVSFIEASSSPVSVGSVNIRASEKNSENSQPQTDSVQSLSLPLGVSKSSGASTNSGEGKLTKPCKSTAFTGVDLSGIEISVDGKPLDVIIEPSNMMGSLDVSIPIKVDQPSNLEISTL
ncbi:E3 ubiquitin-protein ligase RNF19B-like isoform X2 [Thrips palmi]|uniref:RBR-type E3 ubiquitin transferase n=1 Tax=Thrips palmi TaxID=161013 RepID=A0A6P8ZYZ8_THRPL|nr:E3 ubiquitin-protein ligase RNF19B-like isoform X2 [Thrips palmi]